MAWGMGQNQQMEQELASLANRLYEGVLDLNVSPQKIQVLMDQTTSLRNKVLQWYGIEVAPAKGQGGKGAMGAVKKPSFELGLGQTFGDFGKGGGGGFKGAKGGGKAKPKAGPKKVSQLSIGAGEMAAQDWKSTLLRAMMLKRGGPVPKDAVMVDYAETTMEVDGVQKKGYTAAIASEDLVRTYSGGPSKSKKEAEQDACHKAVTTEYPGQQVIQCKVKAGDSAPGLSMGGVGVKRTAAAAGLGGGGGSNIEDKKGRIAHMLRIIIGRPSVTTDLVYDTNQVGGGMFQSTLSLPSYQADAIFQGEMCSSQKAAEQSAAGVAIETLQEYAAPLEEEAKARRTSRRAEKDAAFQAKLAAKKASGAWVA